MYSIYFLSEIYFWGVFLSVSIYYAIIFSYIIHFCFVCYSYFCFGNFVNEFYQWEMNGLVNMMSYQNTIWIVTLYGTH